MFILPCLDIFFPSFFFSGGHIDQTGISDYNVKKIDLDIVVLTEIFPRRIVSTEILKQDLKIEGYDLLLRKETEKSRGVCIYVKTGLSYYECKILT